MIPLTASFAYDVPWTGFDLIINPGYIVADDPQAYHQDTANYEL